jgi:hypothetical protein
MVDTKDIKNKAPLHAFIFAWAKYVKVLPETDYGLNRETGRSCIHTLVCVLSSMNQEFYHKET